MRHILLGGLFFLLLSFLEMLGSVEYAFLVDVCCLEFD